MINKSEASKTIYSLIFDHPKNFIGLAEFVLGLENCLEGVSLSFPPTKLIHHTILQKGCKI